MITLVYQRKKYQISSANVGCEHGQLPDGRVVVLKWEGTKATVVDELPIFSIKSNAGERVAVRR